MKTYQEILNWLFSQLPMYQRLGKAAYKADLDNTEILDKYFNHPHTTYKTIHVAGTNGKGSVSHMLASVLQECGYKVGLYTSPHLKDFRERIKINGEMISEQHVLDFVSSHQFVFEKVKPSFFEMTVAMALDYFARMEIDIAVIEVGMGGRLDSTNIISPDLSVITNIGLDHTGFLGDTIELIAGEKAGIIKEGVPVIVGETQPESINVFKQSASGNNATLIQADQQFKIEYNMQSLDGCQILQVKKDNVIVYPDIKIDLLGIYQKKNLITSLSAIEKLIELGYKIGTDEIYTGLGNIKKNTGLLGRWQILNHIPLTICDTGHNYDGIKAIVEQLNNTAYKNLHFVLGVVDDKNLDGILPLFPKDAIYYFTKANIPRALDENILAGKATKSGLIGKKFISVDKAMNAAKKSAGPDDLIFVGGSTFVVADIL